jgi:Zn-dependent protease with chaperone function
MNFFEQQDQARKRTKILVGLFGLSVAAMTGGIYLVTVAFFNLSGGTKNVQCQSTLPEPIAILASRTSSSRMFGRSSSFRVRSGSYGSPRSTRSFFSNNRRPSSARPLPYTGQSASTIQRCTGNPWWHPQLLFWVMLVTTTVVGGASLYKTSQLRAGGAVVAQELGGRLLLPEQAGIQEQQLLNVVEEMAIASGIPVPQVYLLDGETQINAFAAGFTPENAVIGVTQGSLDQLTRDELQGVIGHEFSHILNGDMRLNIDLLGLLHGILFVYLIGRLLTSVRSSDDRRHFGVAAFGLSIMAIGGMGLLCGRLIQSAVSRQREFLADASAVQFTRNPDGIAGALEKLAGVGSRLASPYAETARHMFFGNALALAWSGDWFATHPPLPQRIAHIRGVAFTTDGEFAQHTQLGSSAMGFAGTVSATPLSADQVVAQVGTVSPAHYTYAQGLLAQLPDTLRMGIHLPEGAIAAVYALFLEQMDLNLRATQVERFRSLASEGLVSQVLAYHDAIQVLDERLRLPLLDLAVPALHQLEADHLQKVMHCIEQLATTDGHWSLSEFILFVVLQRRLETQPGLPLASAATPTSVSPVQLRDNALVLLSALASVGDSKPEAITYAFRCGAFKLFTDAQPTDLDVPPAWTVETLRSSLVHLRQATPQLKQAIVNACAHTVLLDNQVTTQEAELLRAVAITLDCPMPPFLNVPRSPRGTTKGKRSQVV